MHCTDCDCFDRYKIMFPTLNKKSKLLYIGTMEGTRTPMITDHESYQEWRTMLESAGN